MNQAPAPTHDTARAPTRSVTICRVVGIPIRVHWTFAFLVGFVLLADWDTSASVKAEGFLWIAALFVCVIVHEISHCLVARRRGAGVVDILLLPIGGMSELTSMPEAPGDEFAIAIVGPLTSLALGALFAAGGLLLGARMWPPTLFAGSWWARLTWLNLLLGAFNLLPAMPMDGGRVLRAVLARKRSRLGATHAAARVTRVIGTFMVVTGLFFDIWLMVIGLFVLLGSAGEEEAARHPSDHGIGHRDSSP